MLNKIFSDAEDSKSKKGAAQGQDYTWSSTYTIFKRDSSTNFSTAGFSINQPKPVVACTVRQLFDFTKSISP
jgi:hypothetical protein